MRHALLHDRTDARLGPAASQSFGKTQPFRIRPRPIDALIAQPPQLVGWGRLLVQQRERSWGCPAVFDVLGVQQGAVAHGDAPNRLGARIAACLLERGRNPWGT